MAEKATKTEIARLEQRTTPREGVVKFETANVEPHELRAYEVLRRHGHSFTVKAVDPRARQNGLSSLDVEMYGSLWELKCPRGSSKKTITRNLNRAIAQFKNLAQSAPGVRIILSAMETELSSEIVLNSVERVVACGEIDELILILNEGDIRYYKQEAEIPIALLVQMGGCLRNENDSTTVVVDGNESEERKAEIPIALLSQTGGCLRNWEFSIKSEIEDTDVLVRFGCARRIESPVGYSAARFESPRRRCARGALKRRERV